MPILTAEPAIFPNNLFGGYCDAVPEGQWWAVHTLARQEKAFARQMLRQQIPFYLPLVAQERLIRGRRVNAYHPLFGGYVFLYASEEQRGRSLQSNRIAQLLPVADGGQLADDLRVVQQLIASDAPLTVERKLAPGRRVRVKSGSLMGTEGTVLAHRGKSKLVLAVQFLQQGVSIEIDRLLLEPLD